MQINVQFNNNTASINIDNVLRRVNELHAIDSIQVVPAEQTCEVKRSESGSIPSKLYFMKATMQVYQLF